MPSTKSLWFNLPGKPHCVGPTRRLIVAAIRCWSESISEETQSSIELVVSEMLTNAVEHVGGNLTIELRQDANRLVFEVIDGDSDPPLMRAASDDDEGGRGLPLIEALAERWGWELTTAGKKVWAEIELPESHTSLQFRTRGSVCGEHVDLPSRLVPLALEFAVQGTADVSDVERHLRCTLEDHSVGDHYALVMELDGAATGSVWTHWARGHQPTNLLALPDCDAICPATAEPCCECGSHAGGHTWQLVDRWR